QSRTTNPHHIPPAPLPSPTLFPIVPQPPPQPTLFPYRRSSDLSAGTLTITTAASSTPANLLTSLTVGGTGTARTLLITPASNLSGTSDITVSVTDGNCTTNASFRLTVTPVNDPPVITGLTNATVPANQSL